MANIYVYVTQFNVNSNGDGKRKYCLDVIYRNAYSRFSWAVNSFRKQFQVRIYYPTWSANSDKKLRDSWKRTNQYYLELNDFATPPTFTFRLPFSTIEIFETPEVRKSTLLPHNSSEREGY